MCGDRRHFFEHIESHKWIANNRSLNPAPPYFIDNNPPLSSSKRGDQKLLLAAQLKSRNCPSHTPPEDTLKGVCDRVILATLALSRHAP